MSAGFHSLKIIRVALETEDAISVDLEPPADAASAFEFLPGQHLVLRAEIDGEDVRRNYSICVPPGKGPLRIGIKKIDGGRFSTWAMERMRPGETIEAMTPRGRFTWSFSSPERRSYLAVAGGSGITPILSLIETGLGEEAQSRFTLLYGNRASNSIMFLEDLARLKDRYIDRLQLFHFLDDEIGEVELFNGRLDEARFSMIMRSLVDPAKLEAAFVCGPAPMMDLVEQMLIDEGMSTDRILTERFASASARAADGRVGTAAAALAAGMRMTIMLDGRGSMIEFGSDDDNILESARRAGIPAPFACKAGVCATCRAKLVAGDVQMKVNYGLSAEEVRQGFILTCQATPSGAGVVLDFDA